MAAEHIPQLTGNGHGRSSSRLPVWVAMTRRRRMDRAALALAGCLTLASAAAASADPATCPDPKTALGVARTVEVESHTGLVYGAVTLQPKAASLLKPKEVVLTFDDGPRAWLTKSILDTLDKFCTKATFFSVGQMALAHPELVKEELARGHTVGTHTMTHPFGLPRMAQEKAIDEIERGFAAVELAAGQPIAPFFRFTGLADSAPLIAYLKERGIAPFSVDIVTNDSYIPDRNRLVRTALASIERHKGGIILFHDIKTVTAKALPDILAGLKKRGYSVVQLVAKEPAKSLPAVMASIKDHQDAVLSGKEKHTLVPFYGAIEPDRSARIGALRYYGKQKPHKKKPGAAGASAKLPKLKQSINHDSPADN